MFTERSESDLAEIKELVREATERLDAVAGDLGRLGAGPVRRDRGPKALARRKLIVPPPEPPLLVFIDVPKTAGSLLGQVLLVNEPGPGLRPIRNVFKGGGGLDTGLAKRLNQGSIGLDVGGVRILTGHIPLGLRDHLPAYAPERELRYFTFLREPVDRSLSHFYAIRGRRAGTHPAAKFARGPLPDDPTLDDMLELGYVHDNLHTRMLSGLDEPFGEVDGAMLAAAKQNLEQGLVFFGLTERFDESLVLAGRRLGLETLLYRDQNRVNDDRPRGDEVPAELIEQAKRANRYDLELYEHAAELFAAAPELAELDFQIELAALGVARSDSDEIAAPPAAFSGGETEWELLLAARATAVRQAMELAETRAELAAARLAEAERAAKAGEAAAAERPDGGSESSAATRGTASIRGLLTGLRGGGSGAGSPASDSPDAARADA